MLLFRVCLSILWRFGSQSGHVLPYRSFSSHSDTPFSAGVLGRASSLTQWPVPDNAQSSNKTNSHATGGIRTHKPRERASDRTPLRSAFRQAVFCRSWFEPYWCVCCMWWNVMINRSTVAGKHWHKHSLFPKRVPCLREDCWTAGLHRSWYEAVHFTVS
jgi:hypothetical protein